MKLDKHNLKSTARQSVDADFAELLHESKFEKIKPSLKVAIVGVLIVATVFGSYLFLTGDRNSTPDIKAGHQDSQKEDSSSLTEINKEIAPSETSTQNSSSTDNSPQTNNESPSNSTSSSNSHYDPSKCDQLNNQATASKQSSDQQKIIYDNTFSARQGYGDIYTVVRSEYGNTSSLHEAIKVEADKRYKSQEDLIALRMSEWQESLKKSNAAYGQYQECRANL